MELFFFWLTTEKQQQHTQQQTARHMPQWYSSVYWVCVGACVSHTQIDASAKHTFMLLRGGTAAATKHKTTAVGRRGDCATPPISRGHVAYHSHTNRGDRVDSTVQQYITGAAQLYGAAAGAAVKQLSVCVPRSCNEFLGVIPCLRDRSFMQMGASPT